MSRWVGFAVALLVSATAIRAQDRAGSTTVPMSRPRLAGTTPASPAVDASVVPVPPAGPPAGASPAGSTTTRLGPDRPVDAGDAGRGAGSTSTRPAGGADRAARSPAAVVPGPAGTQIVDLGAWTFRTPAAWRSVEPTSSLRRAQMVVPRVTPDSTDAELSVSYLGPSAGTVDANVERWLGQIAQPDGTPTQRVASREAVKVGAFDATIVEAPGVVAGIDTQGPKQACRLVGAIIQTPEGPWFFKAIGPEKTVAAARADLRAAIESFRAK